MSANTIFPRFIKLVKSPYFFVILLALLSLSYFYIDRNLLWFIDSHPNHILHAIAEFITKFGLSTWYIIGFSILILVGIVFKFYKLLRYSIFYLIAIVVPGLFCDVIKIIFGRARPTMLIHHHLYGFYFWQFHANMWSFPSGHTAVAASLATALSLFYPRYWLAFFCLPVLVAASRLVVEAHFLSDVLMGGYIGVIGTWLLYVGLKRYLLFRNPNM